VALLALAYRPLGDYMARVFTGSKHLGVERVFYRVVRIDPDADQRWSTYLLSLLGLSMVSVLFLFGSSGCRGFCRFRWASLAFHRLAPSTPLSPL
jgi:K+-transporting ATPase A subunit